MTWLELPRVLTGDTQLLECDYFVSLVGVDPIKVDSSGW